MLPKAIIEVLERCTWWKEHRKCEKCPKGNNYHNKCPLIAEAPWGVREEKEKR